MLFHSAKNIYRQHWLPWVLLVISLQGMGIYYFRSGII
jgi:hypothetical protein